MSYKATTTTTTTSLYKVDKSGGGGLSLRTTDDGALSKHKTQNILNLKKWTYLFFPFLNMIIILCFFAISIHFLYEFPLFSTMNHPEIDHFFVLKRAQPHIFLSVQWQRDFILFTWNGSTIAAISKLSSVNQFSK